jgi:hypothetical protein
MDPTVSLEAVENKNVVTALSNSEAYWPQGEPFGNRNCHSPASTVKVQASNVISRLLGNFAAERFGPEISHI